MNALEIFTRQPNSESGLSMAIQQVVDSCVAQLKSSNKKEINDTIVSELQEVKSMLD